MMVNAGGVQISAEQIDANVATALRLLAAFSDPKNTEYALREVLKVRDDAVEYAGSVKKLKLADKTLAEAEATLGKAKADAEAITSKAAQRVREAEGELSTVRDELAVAEAELSDLSSRVEAEESALSEKVAKAAETVAGMISEAEADRKSAAKELAEAKALREDYESKISQLRGVIGGTK